MNTSICPICRHKRFKPKNSCTNILNMQYTPMNGANISGSTSLAPHCVTDLL